MSIGRRRLAAFAVVSGLTAVQLTHKARAAAAADPAVAQEVEAFRKAMMDKDRAKFEALCSADLSYGHSAGKVQTKEEFIADATSARSKWKSLEFTDLHNTVAGNNAISRFILTGETESEDKVTPIHIGVLMVWQKQDASWKLLARQAFKV